MTPEPTVEILHGSPQVADDGPEVFEQKQLPWGDVQVLPRAHLPAATSEIQPYAGVHDLQREVHAELNVVSGERAAGHEAGVYHVAVHAPP